MHFVKSGLLSVQNLEIIFKNPNMHMQTQSQVASVLKKNLF